ncbi:heavy metal-binding domain-containing protein [Mucilaginibacter myungsuensis]|uniref:Heavy metal binding domain-containing protein n=1 Tax=Mucilaginibacter myungsuensis TaxID=649104 RepID=A0A929PVG0_9SPHI|nr:heavy metal-binding domain-containing protein [Mucilaginibacter myungsuensis]MBE9660290.1 hypothetical protein [Mucilaginibacter myungsuensis]MDN3600332.1 heavy metal-binding domain-containing protein [Mucilaginibacter myungsuensis]
MKYFIIILSLFTSIAAVSCGSSSEHKGHAAADTNRTTTAKKYTCPMDADVVADKPGTCPKCKMELVEKS